MPLQAAGGVLIGLSNESYESNANDLESAIAKSLELSYKRGSYNFFTREEQSTHIKFMKFTVLLAVHSVVKCIV